MIKLTTDNSKTTIGLHNTASDYEFAQLSPAELEEVNQVQHHLSKSQDKEIVLLAFKKK